MKKEHNVEISHSKHRKHHIEFRITKLSMKIGLFQDIILFDALWVKKNGNWKYLLALFDLELNTIVAKELIDSETVDTIYNFLNQSQRNQKTECIIT